MKNVEVRLANVPGTLARLGRTLGDARVSLEGGGVFADGDGAIANFLVADGELAVAALRAAGFEHVRARDVLIRKLDQGRPGQLGALTQCLADAGVNIEVQYSDHANRLILVVDDAERAARATAAWSVHRE